MITEWVLWAEGSVAESHSFSALVSEYGDPVIAGLLMVSTFGLWWSTARMNHIEKIKMTEALKHDNDNMAEVAEQAIDLAGKHMETLHTLKRVSRRNRKGGIL